MATLMMEALRMHGSVRERLEEIGLINEEPINVAAGRLLPPEWRNNGTLNVLSLMRWLVQEKGIEDTFRPGVVSVLAMLEKLDRWPPKEAMNFVFLSDSGDPMLTELSEDPEEAAVELLQALGDKMVATAP